MLDDIAVSIIQDGQWESSYCSLLAKILTFTIRLPNWILVNLSLQLKNSKLQFSKNDVSRMGSLTILELSECHST